MFAPRLGRLRHDRSASRQSWGGVEPVNCPSLVVNCSSKSGELCKRTKTKLSVRNQRVTALIQRTLRAENYSKISKNLFYSPLLAGFTHASGRRLAQFTTTSLCKPRQMSVQRKRT